ncbi:FG-GAP-like repeat-containing protein [Flavihumibacter petaseus]|nr:FG-GAP-like repeat-containing protein [Flavihumibacter petaseus]
MDNMNQNRHFIMFLLLAMLSFSCKHHPVPNQEMVDLLKNWEKYYDSPKNIFAARAIVKSCDSLLDASADRERIDSALNKKANALLQLGEEQKAIKIFEELLEKISPIDADRRLAVMKDLAVSYLRLGERTNCIRNHSAESCIFPISGTGVHQDKTGSQKAIEIFQRILAANPGDPEAKWLLNIAYMTTGGWPGQVPPQFLLPVSNDDSTGVVKPFADIAANLGLNYKCMAGGCIVEDFDGDDYFDIVISSWDPSERMHYYRNNADGTFTERSDSSGLENLTGGLHMMQIDYNNDGHKDIFVLRGGWMGEFGEAPNSLLKNNGNGTFTDVTKESGLLSFHPTQTATWADFDNDGWLDVFIGNETSPGGKVHPSELYRNNRNGTFTEIAAKAGCAVTAFVKGVTSGDYNNDGRTDIFISTLNGNKILLKNNTPQNGAVQFTDVSKEAGFANNRIRTFPTWFWDYDNDGWPDILVCGYEFTESLSYYAGAEAMNLPVNNAGKVFLFHNKQDGTFEEATAKVGLNKVAFAMGANFGDIDNDGYLDFYLGTGNPQVKSAIPNKLFKNVGGKKFMDITTAARVGNLQKGHAVSFADMDNDGDEDIYIKMGGAYTGDAYENAFYLNPGQNSNHSLTLMLTGTVSNKAAIGAKIKVTFKEADSLRSVYREVNTGGSFGSNPIRQHIGVGSAATIDKVEITWPVTGKTQVYKDLPVDTCVRITEGDTGLVKYKLERLDFPGENPHSSHKHHL